MVIRRLLIVKLSANLLSPKVNLYVSPVVKANMVTAGWKFSPREAGEGFLFENKVVGGAIPKEYIGPIENGVKEAMENGVVAGYPMVDIKVTVYDGSYHEVDSSEMAFKIAGSMGFRSGATKADPVILEPYMKVEVTVPEDYMGDVIGDLNSRRGRIEGMEARNGAQVINAFVPLSEMFGYATDLRSKISRPRQLLYGS